MRVRCLSPLETTGRSVTGVQDGRDRFRQCRPPRDVAWQGMTVRTAVWKAPVTARIFAGRLNLDGDGQADLRAHGGEQRALVYQLESYRYWASRGIATKARMSDHSSWPPNTVRGSYRHSGQHNMVRMRPGPDAPAVMRNYSLCGPPEAPTYRIAVKNERGLTSGFVHQSVRGAVAWRSALLAVRSCSRRVRRPLSSSEPASASFGSRSGHHSFARRPTVCSQHSGRPIVV
jgi:hypothetical protein